MSISRRNFLKQLGIASSSLPLLSLGCADEVDLTESETRDLEYVYDGPVGPETAFEHGVASGDPNGSSAVLWTRVTTDFEEPQNVEVFWQVAHDEAFEDVAGAGYFQTGIDRDYTVKIIPAGLRPGNTYYYRFQALGRTSPIGVTRTVPRGSAERVRIGVTSCSNLRRGYFHAYRNLATRDDLDAVLHLGDYYYESGSRGEVPGRDHEPPWEVVTLEDYRVRFSNYRRDPDLQELHRKVPFIVVWDDHESANDSFFGGAQAHNANTEGDWFERKAASIRAYFEWMPIREIEIGRLWRTIKFGDLVHLSMLDTRLWGRERPLIQAPGLEDERQLLGADQEQWLFRELQNSTAKWHVLGQQVMMAQLKASGAPNEDGGGGFLNVDQWDGYRGARRRLYNVVASQEDLNLVVLTGDIHSSWANELSQDPNNRDVYNPSSGRGSLGVEFVTPGVTSSGLDGLPEAIQDIVVEENPHIKYFDLVKRGYLVLEFNEDYVQADFHHIDDVTTTDPSETIGASWRAAAGTNHLERVDNPLDS